MVNLESATIEALHLQELREKNIFADVLRLDKIHPVISGNKWFKLKYYLQEAQEKNHKTILTFGGAYSNHIIATAFAAKKLGLKSIGIIRGEQSIALSHTLEYAKANGMQLEFISRDDYKIKNEAVFQNAMREKFPGCFIIPEGGAGANGITGSTEILDCVNRDDYSHILCAVGTGTMFAGLAHSSSQNQKVIGICVLKGMHNEYKELIDHAKEKSNCEINHDYHFEGYAKKNDELIKFMNEFHKQTSIPTDFVYTGKLFYAALGLIRKSYFNPQNKLLIIHSGGLQGNTSLAPRTLVF